MLKHCVICLLAFTFSGSLRVPSFATAAGTAAAETLTISQDTVLDATKTYGRIVVTASNITIDGRGAVLQPVGFDATAPKKRVGIAIESTGFHDVVLKNVVAHGWETGLKLVDCQRWTVQDCDFSSNFHDPEFGWGENGRRGGIVLERVRGSKLERNRANQVWDACVLVDAHENTISGNDFSHTSNTGLKLWQATSNTIKGNNFSYGIRKKTDEVHARDSTSVLIESGSNNNRLLNNDCTHGGDGIFVRVLNRWCSTDNYFEGNDCSYANNNGFECWAPRNTFVRNKANHCSYGFWMGGSDQTVLEGNEASYNGMLDGHHNSPHLPKAGHAGIVFMFGPSSHIVARGNRCEHNNGAGIALIGDIDSKGDKWRAFHWLIEDNELNQNRWGVYARFADWIRLSGNHMSGNSLVDVEASEKVTRLTNDAIARQGTTENAHVRIVAPKTAVAGELLTFRLDGSAKNAESIEWDLGDGQRVTGAAVSRKFTEPGFYRVGVNVIGERISQLGWIDLYVASSVSELAADASQWSFESQAGLKCRFINDAAHRVVGPDSIRVEVNPYHGALARFKVTLAEQRGIAIDGKQHLGFWIKSINPNMPGWQSNNPEIILSDTDGHSITLMPKQDLFSAPANNEAREGWQWIRVPLATNAAWDRQGNEIKQLKTISIGVDSWDAGPLTLWIDGLIID